MASSGTLTTKTVLTEVGNAVTIATSFVDIPPPVPIIPPTPFIPPAAQPIQEFESAPATSLNGNSGNVETTTSLSASNGNIESNTVFDEEGLPETIQATLAQIVGVQDTQAYKEGELIIEMENSPQDLFYVINDNGELILVISTGDADNYSIDDEGNLIYTIED